MGSEMILIGTGVGLGVVHVLTGPDHLSALATLSAVSDLCTSFWLGVRWGLGHSTGLLLVGVVLIMRDFSHGAKEDSKEVIDMPDSLSHFFESIVGVFMLFLGAYGLKRAMRLRRELNGHVSLPQVDNDDNSVAPSHVPSDTYAHGSPASYHDTPHAEQDVRVDSLEHIVADDERPFSPSMEVESRQSVGSSEGTSLFVKMWSASRRLSVQSLAVGAGIIHGLAGPGGVLGVIPAVQLHDWKLATIYLSSFCLSSTLTMGCFASCYGLLSWNVGKKADMEFQIHCFSSILSILVGLTWLILLAMGKLEEVFP